ncbi:unnamed protein product [Paramecium pentaurelia]|uniref:HECT domain-containing protein n=1 Tax=Paramecium pentaurelia TaxID=43138 RepID=A0A8S1YP60_9CILI|nr:unnamed protein product [Paramecium pentaurelia]
MLAKLFKIPNFDRFIIIQGFNSSQCLEKALQLIDEWERELGSTLEKVTFLHFNQKMLIENCSIQTYQIASRLSEILHYLSQLLFQNNNLVNNQNQSAKLIDKCCALLEIVLVTENENKNASIILFQILRQAIRQQQNNNNNLQPLSRLLIRLIIESNNHPTMTLQLLKKINNSFNQVNLDQNIEKIIIDSQFGNHLQDVIQNYILMINTDSSNTQLINQLGDEINKILEYLYRVPNILTQGTDLLVISKIISDIGSLIQITKNSSQENIKKIQIFLLQQANSISRPGFLKNFDGISQNRIHEQLMIQLEQMGYQSQLINNVLMENPRIRNAGQFIDFMTLNQQRLEVEGKLTQQSDELLIQQIKAQQESIRLQLKENIKLFSNFNNLIGLEIQLNLSEILSILQLSVQKQFNLSLQFQGVEIEMSNQPDYNLQSIILVLSLLYKQQIQQQRQQQQLEQQQQQQQQQQQEQLDSIAKELLKLLDVLLDQVADDLTIKAVNFILAVLSNLITKNQEYLNLILVGVQKTLDSNVQNHITFQICIEILVKVFQKNRSCINQFVQQMNGLQSVFKVKGDSYNHFISLSKLSLAIIYDKIIIRAQIEAQIKKTIFDQENKEEVQKTNQQLDLQHYQNENIYPIQGIKNCDINRYFNYRDQLFFMIKTLNILYQVATNLLLEKTEPVITNSLSVNQMELGIIGQINPIEINDQVFQNDQTYQRYQEYNSQNEQFQYYLQNWPFLSIKNSQLQVNADQQMEPDIHQMLNIPLIIDSQEIFDKELEEELNYWTDDVQYIIEEEPENNQNIDNSYNGFINGISDQLENQIYRTIKFQGLRFPYQFQISLQEFKQILPSQNNAQLMPNFNRWQLNLYQENINQLPNVIRNQLVPRLGMMDQLPNIFRNQLGPRLGMMNQLPNVNRIILGPRLGMMDQQLNLNRNQNQNFGNVQNQNINNNGVDDDEENEDMIDQINFEMGLGQNQRNNYDFQMEYGNQQQQQQPNNSPLRQNIQPQFLQIKNIVNSVLNNRKQTLKHLGKIDQQLIQFLLKFLYVDDNFGSNYDYINTLLISLGIKANFNNQIIQAAINTLKKTTQNQIQENADQQTFILSRNEIIRDFDYSSNFIQNKAFKLLLQLQSTSKQNISDENIKDFFGLLFKLKGNSLKQLLQFLANQEQKYQLTLAPEQVKMLYNFMIEQDDIQNSSNCMKFISNLWNVDKNAYKLMSYMKFQIISISEYYTNQFLNQQQVEQTFKQLNEVEKIFQMIYIASKDEQQLEQCRIFVNSNEIQDLFNILDQLISQIQNLHDCRYNQRLLPILKVFLICHQIIHPIANQNLQLLKVSSIEISQPEISQTESIGNLIDFERLFNILCQNGSEYINQIVKEQIYKMITYYRTIRQNQQRRNDYLFENDFLDGIFTYHPQVIKFQNKKDYFYQKQQINGRNQQQIFGGGRMLRIRREYIFEDSYIKIKSITDPNILKEQFEIIFEGEQGIDAGGLTKDWIYKLSEQIVDQKYKLFIPNSDNTCFIINRESSCDPDHLNKFKFVGKIFAIAILTKVPIYGQFPISMFKHIIGQKLSRADIQNYDEGLNNTFDLIYNQKIDSSWNLFWAYTIKQGGVPVDVELKPGGKDIEVTEYDKKDYVRKYCHQIMAKDIEDQIKAIQDGFYSLISKEDIKIFDSIQLELLLCGESNIDVEDLIRTLRYQGYTAQHQVIGWLKNILRSFNQDMLAKFLSLATGHPKLPVGGFQNPECRITIRLPNYQQNDIDSRLPTGHTCTRVLDLPAYSNEETLRKQLETALNEGGEGFDLA